MSTKKRIDWVDVAKGICMILVIISHAEEHFIPGQMATLKVPIYSFHMPLFFFMSGYLFSMKSSFGEFLKGKCKRILVPYFYLGGILILFDTYWNNRNPFAESWFNKDYFMYELTQLLTQKRFWTLWFIACLFWMNIIFYVIVRFVKNEKIRAAIVTILAVAGLVYYRLGGGAWFWNMDVCLTTLPFFYVGYLCRKTDVINQKLLSNKKYKPILFVGFIVINAACAMVNWKVFGGYMELFSCQYGMEPLTYISAFAGIFAVIILADWCNWFPLRYIGVNTMLLYAWHQTMVLPILQEFYKKHGMFTDFILPTWKYYGRIGLTTLICCVVLCLVNEIICRIKLGFLVGK